MPIDEYIRVANEQTFVGIQIEDEDSLSHAEEMAAVDGVDFLFLGPGDFSILSGVAGQMDHPKIQNAMETIANAAKNTGKNWGRPVGSLEQAKTLIDMGARIIGGGADVVFLRKGLDNMQEEYGKLGFSFESSLPPL